MRALYNVVLIFFASAMDLEEDFLTGLLTVEQQYEEDFSFHERLMPVSLLVLLLLLVLCLPVLLLRPL